MKFLVVNLAGRTRRVFEHGREYLVAPMTLIVPGVLHGNKGPLLYPDEEVGKNPGVWNNIPLLVNHPYRNGVPVRALNNPDVLEAQGIGMVRNDRFDGKRRADGWFDVEKTKRVDTRIYKALLTNKPFELSTGLDTTDLPASKGALHNGSIPYAKIATNYKPDHVAVFMDARGACSNRDGCGVLVNSSHRELGKKAGTMKEKLWKKIGRLLGINTGVYGNPQSKNTGRFKKLGAGSGKGDIYDAALAGTIVLSDLDKSLGAVASQQAAAGQNPASWVEDEETWDRAKAAADKGNYSEDAYWAVVTHIYQKMGGTVKQGTENEEPVQVLEQHITTNIEGDPDMNRDAMIKWLTTNCEEWKGGAALLKPFNDAALKKLHSQAVKAKQNEVVVNSITSGDLLITVNEKCPGCGYELTEADMEKGECPECGKKLTANQLPEFIQGHLSVNSGPDDDDDDDDTPVHNCGGNGGGRRSTTVNRQTPRRPAQPVKPKSLKEFKKSLPPEALATWNTAERIVNERKIQIIEKLTANISDEDRRKQVAVKYAKSYDVPQLEEMAEMLGINLDGAGGNSDNDDPVTNYFLAAGSTRGRSRGGRQLADNEAMAKDSDNILAINSYMDEDEEDEEDEDGEVKKKKAKKQPA